VLVGPFLTDYNEVCPFFRNDAEQKPGIYLRAISRELTYSWAEAGRGCMMAPMIDLEKDGVKPGAVAVVPFHQKIQEAEMHDNQVKLPLALREDLPLSVEAAQKMRQILDDPGHPAHAGKEMPTADMSVLLKKSQ
jgi:hypothetical protein